MTNNLVEQFRGKGPKNGGYVSGLNFKDLEGHEIAKWLRENGYKARAIGRERFACAQTACGMRVYSNGYICDVHNDDLDPKDTECVDLKTDEETMTVAQNFNAQAKQHDQNAADSFDRCDTDGFLSQWASGLSAELARERARIAANGGVDDFPRLFDIAEDREINAKLVNGRYGAVWLVDDEDAHQFNGRKFIPFEGSGNRSRIQKKLGLEERFVLRPAHAILTGKGTGLSGSAWVTVIETDKVLNIYKEGK